MDKGLHQVISRNHLTVAPDGTIIATNRRGSPVVGRPGDDAATVKKNLKTLHSARRARTTSRL